MSDEDEALTRGFEAEGYPWGDVEIAREDEQLQAKHPVTEGRKRHGNKAKPCPKCQAAPERLSWFYFSSPPSTWEGLCGVAGWMTVCDNCRVQVDFFKELVS